MKKLFQERGGVIVAVPIRSCTLCSIPLSTPENGASGSVFLKRLQ